MIEAMRVEDIPAVCSIEQACFGNEGWTPDSFRFEIEENSCSVPLVLKEEDKIVGYAVLWILFEQAQIASIAISPALRRRHFGRRLLNDLIQRCQKAGCEWLSLEVRVSNQGARAMYEQAGFSQLHVVKRYYSDGEDAVLMGLGI